MTDRGTPRMLSRTRTAALCAVLGAALVPATAQAKTNVAARAKAEGHARAIVNGYRDQVAGLPDCEAPAGDPAPGTQAWNDRDTANQYCATERLQDEYTSPAFGSTFWAETPGIFAQQNVDMLMQP